MRSDAFIKANKRRWGCTMESRKEGKEQGRAGQGRRERGVDSRSQSWLRPGPDSVVVPPRYEIVVAFFGLGAF